MKRRAGFILITSAAAITGLLIVVGLAVDLGHIYVARAELQVFADEAAVAAAFELDGTAAGMARAREAAASGPGAGVRANRWNFSTDAVAPGASEFATAPGGPFDSNPVTAAGLRFVRVTVSGNVPLYFLALLPGIANPQGQNVTAVAGQVPRYSLGNGVAPFSPTAHDASDPQYGFQVGQLYTLRWAPKGQRSDAGACTGDAGFDPGSDSERGYVDVGQGSGSSALRAAVIDNSFYLPQPLTVGGALNMYTGQESVPDAVEQRFAQDTDVTSTSFADYHGNGRRLLSVAVNGGGDPARILGFACFFLHPAPCGTKNTTPCCAEFVGGAVVNSNRPAVAPTGLYQVQLIQ